MQSKNLKLIRYSILLQSEPQFSPINENELSKGSSSGMDIESPVACYNLRDQNIDYLPPSRKLFDFVGPKGERKASSPIDSQPVHSVHRHLDSHTGSSKSNDFQQIQLASAMQRQQQQSNYEQSILSQSLPDDDKSRTKQQKPSKRRSIDDKPIMV